MKKGLSKGQVTPAKPSGGVIQQQGCVVLDADFDEQKEILRYLAANPGAKDTVEGISQWWLPQAQPAAVKAALAALVAQGLVVEERQSATVIHYRKPRLP